MSTPPSQTRPEVGRSRPEAQRSKVDLPEPDGPMTVVNVPRSKPTLSPAQRIGDEITCSQASDSWRRAVQVEGSLQL